MPQSRPEQNSLSLTVLVCVYVIFPNPVGGAERERGILRCMFSFLRDQLVMLEITDLVHLRDRVFRRQLHTSSPEGFFSGFDCEPDLLSGTETSSI